MRRTALVCILSLLPGIALGQSLADLPAPRLLPTKPASAGTAGNGQNWRPSGQSPLVVPPRPVDPPQLVQIPPSPPVYRPAPTMTAPRPAGVGGIQPVQFDYLAPEIPAGPPVEPPLPGQLVPPAAPLPTILQSQGQQSPMIPQAPAPPQEPGATAPMVTGQPVAPPATAMSSGMEPPFSYASPPWLTGAQCDNGGLFGNSCDSGCLSDFGNACGYDPNDTGFFMPFASFQFKPGDSRVLGDGRAFLPLFQSQDNLLFADIRGQIDDYHAAEGNWGLGFRSLDSSGWIFGMYGYYDLLHSRFNNNFSQGTFGVELLSLNWDFRLNGYVTETGTKLAGAAVAVNGGNLVVNNFGEKAYGGIDFETGYRVGRWGENDRVELRWFVGGYALDAAGAGFKAMVGPRTRLELRLYDLDFFGYQSRLETGAEFTYDRVRDEQVFGFVRLRVPLSVNPRNRLSPLRRRMVDLPVRDMDVASNRQVSSTDRAMTANGTYLDQMVHVTSQDDYFSSIYNAGQNSLVVLDGSKGGFYVDGYQSIALQNGQMLAGGGSSITLYGEHTGQAATMTLPGTRPEIFHDRVQNNYWNVYPLAAMTDNLTVDSSSIWPIWNWNPATIQLANNSSVQGIDLIGGGARIYGQNVTNVHVNDVSVRHGDQAGIELQSVQHATLTNVTVQDAGRSGIVLNNTRDVTIDRALLERTSGSSIELNGAKETRITNSVIRDVYQRGDIFYLAAADMSDSLLAPAVLPIIIEPPFFYVPNTNGISGNDVQDLTIDGNNIAAQQAISLFGTSGDISITNNAISLPDTWLTGVTIGNISSGSLNFSNNHVTSAGDNWQYTALWVSTLGENGQDVLIADNRFDGLHFNGLSYRHMSTEATETVAVPKVTIRGNQLNYDQFGSANDWSNPEQVDALSIESSGTVDVVLQQNTVKLDALGGEFAPLRSRAVAHAGGNINLDLISNTIPIQTFDLVQEDNGQIHVGKNTGNTFSVP